MSAGWSEYGYEVADTTHDDEGNKMVEMTIYLQTDLDRHDIVNAVSDFLEEKLK